MTPHPSLLCLAHVFLHIYFTEDYETCERIIIDRYCEFVCLYVEMYNDLKFII